MQTTYSQWLDKTPHYMAQSGLKDRFKVGPVALNTLLEETHIQQKSDLQVIMSTVWDYM